MGERAEKLMKLVLQRSIYYPTAEIYSDAPGGFWDFGPYGNTIRRKVIDFWRKELVQKENFLEVDGAQLLPEIVFKASGHLDNFNDPIVDCEKCNHSHRLDKLLESVTGERYAEGATMKHFESEMKKHKIVCPGCKSKLSKPRKFNLMMPVNIGATKGNTSYLRGEACQNIFLNFPRLFKTMRVKMPFGISQVGKAFRNEISPRNNLVRTREFVQMDCEIFFDPKENKVENFKDVAKYKIRIQKQGSKKQEDVTAGNLVKKKIVTGEMTAYYMARTQQMYEKLGIPHDKIRFIEMNEEERAFYAKETWDCEVLTDAAGWVELNPINYRTDWDLSTHGKHSGKDLTVKREDKTTFTPHVLEISIGTNRVVYSVLEHVLRENKGRSWLALNPKVAPFDVAVFPLMKKDGLAEKAQEIHQNLLDYDLDSFYDQAGSVGKRYARVDEIGVPLAVTVDYGTIGKDDPKQKNTVTVRERDSTKQKRIPIEDLAEFIWGYNNGKTKF
ncbi:MAG: glycine--tRNA ligase [Candidatus Diapherotrites archaeon]|nr:glycine--tRNA ligase [Candidatus Diapherotrites archaeon]